MSEDGFVGDRLAFYEALLEHTEDAIVGVDRDWLITVWSKGAERMYGWSAVEVLGRHVPSFVRMNLTQQERAETRREIAERGRWRGEATVQRKDGSMVAVEVINVAVRDRRDEITGYLGIHRDMTERKLAERALRDAQRRSETILESIGDSFFALDRRWRYAYLNEQALQRVRTAKGAELAREDVLGQNCWEFIPGTVGTAFYRELHRAVREHTTVGFEAYSAATDTWTEVRAYPSADGLSVYARDVSERKRAEAALREAQRRSETILESISDDFFALDREWRYTYVNERGLAEARRIPGRDLTAADLLGANIWERFPQLIGTTFDHESHRALREQTVVEFQQWSPVTGRWVEARVYPSDAGLSIHLHDISERKAAQEEISRRAEQQALVAELGQRALASDDLQPLLDEAVGLVARTLDVELAGVAEIAPDHEQIVLRAGVGWQEGVVGRRIGHERRDSLFGYTLRCPEPVIVDDMATDRRFTASATARDHGVVSALSVMIESPGEPFGVLAALSTLRRTFSSSDLSFVQAVANVLASAVERSRAQERLGEVREAERSRIARDLHDDALQELTDALVQADRGRSAGLTPDAAGRLISTLKHVGQQLRGAIYDLRVSDDVHRPFPDALRTLIDVQRSMAVDCEVDLDIGPGPRIGVLGNRGTEVLRIVGEALTNARRHSGARHVLVTARGSEDGGLLVDVTDHGRGYDRADEPSGTGGRGIQGMRERAALLGADLDIRSTPRTGTTVRISLGGARDARPRGTARILLVEDHAVVRQAIAAMFEHEPDLDVVAQAGSLAEARGMLHDVDVDVAILDLGLPDGRGGDLISDLRDVNPRAQAVVLSASLDPIEITRAIDSGAAAALDKTAELDELVDAVRRLHRGAAPPP
ncbi:MAG: domain S-box protein [Solirubrobacterales bacterium]|nr:domain S-box protein [Solirubrobacterales bacterium]